jgi:8-oxo-dGTP diphosphatase
MSSGTVRMTKIGGVIQDNTGHLLVVKKHVPGRNTYIIPGGQPEGTEAPLETLKRELFEELGVKVAIAVPFGDYEEPSEFEDAVLSMTVFDVTIEGIPSPQSEIIDLMWISRDYAAKGISIGSVLANHVVPRLIELGRM